MKNGNVKIGGLGSARFVKRYSNTITPNLEVSFKYKSPEMFKNERINKKTDIWYIIKKNIFKYQNIINNNT